MSRNDANDLPWRSALKAAVPAQDQAYVSPTPASAAKLIKGAKAVTKSASKLSLFLGLGYYELFENPLLSRTCPGDYLPMETANGQCY